MMNDISPKLRDLYNHIKAIREALLFCKSQFEPRSVNSFPEDWELPVLQDITKAFEALAHAQTTIEFHTNNLNPGDLPSENTKP